MGLYSLQGMLLLATPLAPLLAAAALLRPLSEKTLRLLAALSSLPALGCALVGGVGDLHLDWLLLGSRLGLDPTGRLFLLFTALVWLASGLYAGIWFRGRASFRNFLGFFLPAMAGNFGAVLAHDMVDFFTFYALMSFAAYGLVVHDGSGPARRAGRVYIVLVVLGEVLLFSALLLLAEGVGSPEFSRVVEVVERSPERDLILLLLVAGFGLKAGLVPLHVALPLTYAAAPLPAGAALSVMTKVGLLGLLRFLPLGGSTLPGWAGTLTLAGLVMALYGVAAGLAQRQARALLAYSSISQLGYLFIGIGIGLSTPGAWPGLGAALALYALHHGLAKGALFLGVGMAPVLALGGFRRVLLLAGLLLPALALCGAPLTSGALVKASLKGFADLAAEPWPGVLEIMFPVAAVGTTALMARFLFLLWPGRAEVREKQEGLGPIWAALLILVGIAAWLVPGQEQALAKAFSLGGLWGALWPVGLGALLAWMVGRWARTGRLPLRWDLPPGDVLVIYEGLAGWLTWIWARLVAQLERMQMALQGESVRCFPQKLSSILPSATSEGRLRNLAVAGALLLVLFLANLLFLIFRD
ncbi:hypothetical protein DESUT3_06490 [Desulfuromonas versatilis]|uniref:NADH:quinone oxidoreductase/Mrp antiporter transmembrane domain-containing protein n=1 Tax=Desulfuromonas versatilis TaxID=2802975 RepID=A0ABM8HT04_9BACT|nr:hypothetical protein DESUT3_06490 [Desulfuromonas versatilis]